MCTCSESILNVDVGKIVKKDRHKDEVALVQTFGYYKVLFVKLNIQNNQISHGNG